MTPDFLDLLRALLAADARFMIVGAYAVGVHGRPRATKDLDVWVEATSSNAPRVMAALREFGAPLMGLTEPHLEQPGMGLQIGVEPGRIDVLTAISGVRFEDAWPAAVQADFAPGVRCHVIGLNQLLQNKRAAGDLRILQTWQRWNDSSASSTGETADTPHPPANKRKPRSQLSLTPRFQFCCAGAIRPMYHEVWAEIRVELAA